MIAPGRPTLSEPATPAVTDLELQLLLEAVFRMSGHDFREYAPAMLRRRILERVRAENLATISGLQERVLHDTVAMDRLVETVTFNPSSPFRDPAFFSEFLAAVLPRLRTFPHVRIWVAGCGAGDDAYALAILAKEAGFYNRIRIYATDVTDASLESARTGAFPAASLDEAQSRYAAAGGNRRLSDYLDVEGATARYRESLRDNIVFAQHNLATDGSFNEFHLIVLRHTLMKFNRNLVYHAHQVVYESLVRLGFLGVGSKETLRFTPHQRVYEPVAGTDMFHRRMR